MDTKYTFEHTCKVSGNTEEIVNIILWLGENIEAAPHKFSCSSYMKKDYTTKTEEYIVNLTINFTTLEGASAFKLKWMI